MQLNAKAAARFAADLAALWPDDERAGPLGLAVSGGPDSLALMLLAAEVLPGSIAIASVDHGLRAEAAGEVALVGRIAAERGIPFTPLRVNVPPGNAMAGARTARYAALARWAADHRLGAVATAHHADDQAETLLMRLDRGSGLAGLAGVRAQSRIADSQTLLLRPLLGWRKAELGALVEAAGLVAAQDPSNTDPAFDRTRMRRALAEADWLDPMGLATSAGHLAEAWQALGWYAELDWHDMVLREENDTGMPGFTYCANAPRIIGIETLLRIITALGGQATRGEVGRAWDRLWAGDNASLGGVLAVPGVERVEKVGVMMRVWRFRPEPPRASLN